MAFADFHIHGNFKSFYTAYKVADKKSPWEKVVFEVDKILFPRYGEIFTSQSDFTKILNGQLTLAMMPLYSTERGFPDSTLMTILNLVSKNIDDKLFGDLKHERIPHFQELLDCYAHLLRAGQDPEHGNMVRFTRCFEDIDQTKINVIHSIEGSHAFLDRNEDVTTPAGWQKIEDRIKLFKKRDPGAQYPRIFVINFTHLTRAPFSNHAFGIKIIDHVDFIPEGKSISPAGLKLIDILLHRDDEHYPIIIDIKHMSVESRKQYYKIRRAGYSHIPIVASHAGCTGIPMTRVNDYIEEINTAILNKTSCNLVSYYKPQGVLKDTAFNPWSINLYEEDIIEIFSSGGIIGLSLDQRIIGTGKVVREKMSRAETFQGVRPDRPLWALDPEEEKPINNQEIHFRHFVNQIFYLVWVGRKIPGFDDQGWDRIVIGSDFDGLVDAVDFCPNAEHYRNIETLLNEKLKAYADEAHFVLPDTPQVLARKIVYQNGLHFLEKYYKRDSF